MHIVTILGSPRRRGNTAAVLGEFERLATVNHRLERINVVQHKIKGCKGCGACQKRLDEPGCQQRDDTLSIFQRMMAADAIVYATPLYAWSYPAQLKALIDRQYCLTKWGDDGVVRSLLTGKCMLLLVTCGDAIENNADTIQVEFDRQMDAARSYVVGHYIVPHCGEPADLGERAPLTARAMLADLESRPEYRNQSNGKS